MSAPLTLKAPYLRVQRLFPQEAQPLSVEIDRAYVDIASNMNVRKIAMIPTETSIQNGEILFINGQKFSGFTRAYTFTATTAISHQIGIDSVNQFVSCYGTYSDGTNSYGLIYGTSVAIAGVIQFYMSATQILFVVGAGAPALTSGRIVLNWFNG